MRTLPQGAPPDFEVSISSLVVLCRPKVLSYAVDQIKLNPLAEVHAIDKSGKIIVVLETPCEQNILDGIEQLEAINGVISATLVYHQID